MTSSGMNALRILLLICTMGIAPLHSRGTVDFDRITVGNPFQSGLEEGNVGSRCCRYQVWILVEWSH